MGIRTLAVAWILVSLGGAGKLRAVPQEPGSQAKPNQEQKNDQGTGQAEQQGSTEGIGRDEEKSVSTIEKTDGLARRFLLDQKAIWTNPAQARWYDINWLLPLSGVTAGMFVTDADMSRHISHNPTTLRRYSDLSNAGIAALLGAPAGMWLLSYPEHNEHWRETGFLAGEAVLNSVLTVEAMKYGFGRQRPFQDNSNGEFFKGGVSFPSEHATAAFAAASVVAHEHPGVLTKIAAYGLAGLVDYSRYRARQHFPSDVFIGSVIGNMVAEDIYTRDHDPELGGTVWNSFRSQLRQTHLASSANMGSPYVPLDSWVYPAMDRLIAQGLIRSALVDMRPWTRFECARLITEASEQLESVDASSSPAWEIYRLLADEFREDRELLGGGENNRAQMESAYTGVTGISGKPLSQGYDYDFGQTIINDFGRPYEEGLNNVTGFSGWATESRFVVYGDAEFQHAPSAPPLTASARQVIAQVTGPPSPGFAVLNIPEPPGTPISAIDRFQLLDTYVGMAFANWQISFGKQSLWWGPGEGGPMMFSDNAEPILMFRVNRVSPLNLPSVLGLFGPMRIEFFVGQLTGQNFVYGDPTGLLGSWTTPFSPQPMLSGERFSFKPTPNVEFGFSASEIFAGEGVPFNWHKYLQGVFRFEKGGNPGTPTDPGDGRSGFDLSYRLPFVRNWATFYADGFNEDEFTPVAYWDRAAWTGGLYISHFPKSSKLDLRMEGVYTDLPVGGEYSRGYYYWNDRYLMGYTNQGNLLGSWIGRQGQGAQVWSNYWFTPKNRIQLNFRHEKISQQYIPGGGTITDFGGEGDYAIRKDLDMSLSLQYERWLIPSIEPGAQRNFTASVMFRFHPAKSPFPRGDSNPGGNEGPDAVPTGGFR